MMLEATALRRWWSLYSLLVSEGGFAEAMSGESDAGADAAIALTAEVGEEFQGRGLLGDTDVKFPVHRNSELLGAKPELVWKADFVQQNGHLCVMQTIDFGARRRVAARDHAGFSSYMFRDLLEKDSTTEAIAIVRYTPADLEHSDVRLGLAVLKDAAQIVDWSHDDEREKFIRARIDMANAGN